jgi:signal transduction histidine kinase
LEGRLQRAQKAESLARMAGAVAHHFNNLLTMVIGNLELAMDDLPRDAGRNNVAAALNASHRAAEISRFMLTYVGQVSGDRKPIDLNEAVEGVLPVLGASIPGAVCFQTRFSSRKPIILADMVQIGQILACLVSNAVEAIGDKVGVITVATEIVAATQIRNFKAFPTDWKARTGSYACLSVSDDGCGVEVSILENIFDPFFSTKFTGRGMGLSVVLGLMRAHEGAITIESLPGGGSTFRLFFPLSGGDLS